jgi:spore maturation protein SpmB
MGAMVLNFSANALGLGNAATPFGIKAMHELQKLNGTPEVATHAMITFLAINMSSITLLPSGVIGVRAAMGSADPAGILPTTLFATGCSTATALVLATAFAHWTADTPAKVDESVDPDAASARPWPLAASLACLAALVAAIPLTLRFGKVASPWMIPTLVLALVGFGLVRRVPVYEAFVDGAKEGFQVAIRITPFVVGILVAVGMFKASGALEVFTATLGPVTSPLGLPAEALPMVFIRPLSGTGALAVMMGILRTEGVDSYVGYLVSTINGCTETIFYTMAVYFGAVGIKRSRHLLFIALFAETAGVIGAVIATRVYLGL